MIASSERVSRRSKSSCLTAINAVAGNRVASQKGKSGSVGKTSPTFSGPGGSNVGLSCATTSNEDGTMSETLFASDGEAKDFEEHFDVFEDEGPTFDRAHTAIVESGTMLASNAHVNRSASSGDIQRGTPSVRTLKHT